jgi:hypothetical protein
MVQKPGAPCAGLFVLRSRPIHHIYSSEFFRKFADSLLLLPVVPCDIGHFVSSEDIAIIQLHGIENHFHLKGPR